MPRALDEGHSHTRFFRARSRASLRALTLVAAISLAASGCGNSNEVFTTGESDRALAALDTLQAAVETGHCGTAGSRVNALIGQAQAINRDRPNLGAAYAQSVDQLRRLVDRECRANRSAPTEPVTGSTGETAPTPGPTGGAGPTPAPAPEPTGGAGPTAPATQPKTPAPGGDGSGGVRPG